MLNLNEWAIVESGLLKGYKLFPDTQYSAFDKMLAGDYDDWLFEKAAELQLVGKTVWDIGVEVGFHTLALAKLVGATGQVISIEPSPSNISRIQRHLEGNPDLGNRVRIIEAAAAEQDGRVDFMLSDDPDLGVISHIESRERPGDRVREEIYQRLKRQEVTARSIDSLIDDGVPPPVFIKVDVEGAEYRVLQGACKTLKMLHPTLCIEIHNVVAMFDVTNFFRDYSYQLGLMGEHTASRAFLWAEPNKS